MSKKRDDAIFINLEELSRRCLDLTSLMKGVVFTFIVASLKAPDGLPSDPNGLFEAVHSDARFITREDVDAFLGVASLFFVEVDGRLHAHPDIALPDIALPDDKMEE
jgi:hypothetical protein